MTKKPQEKNRKKKRCNEKNHGSKEGAYMEGEEEIDYSVRGKIPGGKHAKGE